MGLEDFDATLGEITARNRLRAAQPLVNLTMAYGSNPDDEALKLALQRQTGVPALFMSDRRVRRNAEKQAYLAQPSLQSLNDDFPVTARFLATPANAMVAHDDIGSLQQIEDLGTALDGTTFDEGKAGYYSTEYVAKPFKVIQGGLGKLATKLAFPIAAGVDALNGDDYYKEFASQLYDTYDQIHKESAASPQQGMAGKVFRTVETLVPFVLTGGAGLGALAGQATNDRYDELTGQGVDPDTALALSMKAGMSAAVMSKLPLGGGSLTNSLVRGMTFNPAYGVLDRALDKAGLNYAGYGKQADDIKLLDPDTLIHDAVLGSLFSLHHSIRTNRPIVAGSVAESLLPFYDRYRAGRRADVLTGIGKVVQDSKIYNRTPDLVQRHLNDVAAEHAGVENAYVPVERWNELFRSGGLDPAQVAEETLSRPEAYREALATGSDIVIPFGEFAGKLSRLEQYGELVKDARLSLGDVSQREAEARVQALKDHAENGGGFMDALKNMFARSQETVKGNESYRKVYDDLVGQQAGIGVERGTGEHNAHLVANAFRVLGDRSGVDPFELYSNYNLKLSRPMDKTLAGLVNGDAALDPLLERLRAGDVPKEADVFGPSLLDTLRETGLKDSGGELAKREVDADRQPFQRKIVRNDGMELDKAREMLVGKGYLREGSTVNDLLDAIDTEMRGGRVSSDQYRNAKLMGEHLALTQLHDHLDRMGVNLHKMSNEEIRKVLTVPMGGHARELWQKIQNNKDALHEILEVAKDDKNKHLHAKIGEVDPWVVDAAKEQGIDINGYQHSIDTDSIRHIFKKHGDEKVETKRGQVVITDSDIERIPEIIFSPDKVVFGVKNSRGQELIAFLKTMSDGSTLYVEEVRKGRRELATASMRKYPPTSRVENIITTLDSTAKTDGGNVLSVVEPPSDVKTLFQAAVNNFAAGGGREAYQAGPKPVAELTGKELGESGDIKELRKAAFQWYRDNLQGKPVERNDLGSIAFTRKGIEEFSHFGADPAKIKMVTALRDIIQNGDYIETQNLDHPRRDGITKFHVIEADVSLEGEIRRARVVVGEDRKGNKFYELFPDAQENDRNRNRHRGPEIKSDVAAASLEGETTLNVTISQPYDSVNIQFVRPGKDNARRGVTLGHPMDSALAGDKSANGFWQTDYGTGEMSSFGPVWRDLRHDAQKAVERLAKYRTGEAIAALHHPDVGDIDLVWGKEGTKEEDYEDGFGLAKIVKKHPEVIDNMQGILDTLVKDTSKSGNSYIVLESSDHKAVVRLDWDRENKVWLLTEFEKNKEIGTGKRAGASSIAESGSPILQSQTNYIFHQKTPDVNTLLQSAASHLAADGVKELYRELGEHETMKASKRVAASKIAGHSEAVHEGVAILNQNMAPSSDDVSGRFYS